MNETEIYVNENNYRVYWAREALICPHLNYALYPARRPSL